MQKSASSGGNGGCGTDLLEWIASGCYQPTHAIDTPAAGDNL
jgi:hypothetical protein